MTEIGTIFINDNNEIEIEITNKEISDDILATNSHDVLDRVAETICVELNKIKDKAGVCKHKWVYQVSYYDCKKIGYYTNEYSKKDVYYCEKCCETKTVTARYDIRDIRCGTPSWWQR